METGLVFLIMTAFVCSVLSVLGSLVALDDEISNEGKRNIFLLSSLLALWAIISLLAVIAAKL